MHTSRFESCSMIHNGDYSGEIIVTNEGSDEVIKDRARLDTSMAELLKIYRKGFRECLSSNAVITIEHKCQSDNASCHNNSPKIAIYFRDLNKFICSALESRVISTIESQSLNYAALMRLMKKVGAKPLDE